MLLEQPLCVLMTLPHASAAISKTGSKRKEGLLYIFFETSDTRDGLSVVLSLFKVHPPLDLPVQAPPF
jgi:hypothetical protein